MAARSDIEAGRAFVRLYVKNAEFQRGIKEGRRLLSDFASSMESVGRRIAAVAIAGAVPAVLATNAFAKWDDQMREVRAITQALPGEMDRLREHSKKMAVELGFSAIHVGELMAELGRANFAATEIEAATKAVLNLSRATKTDAALAAKIMAETLKQFGMSASESSRIADMLTVTANRSISTVESLGDSLRYVGPVAAQFGLAIEEVLALVGGLSNIGLQGELAGTSLRRLLTITASQAAEMRRIFGVEFTAGGGMKSLIDSLSEVSEKMKGMTVPEKAAKFYEAFGILGITGASAIGNMTDSLKDLLEHIKAAGGESSRQSKEMNAGLGGTIRRFKALLEVVGIEFGQIFSETLNAAIEKIAIFMVQATDFAKANKGLIISIMKVGLAVAAFGAAIIAVGATLGLLKFSLSAIFAVAGGFALLGSIFTRSVSRVLRGGSIMSQAIKSTMHAINTSISSTIASAHKSISSLLAGPVPQLSVVLRASAGGISTAIMSLSRAMVAAQTGAQYFIQGLMGVRWGLRMLTLPALIQNLYTLGSTFRYVFTGQASAWHKIKLVAVQSAAVVASAWKAIAPQFRAAMTASLYAVGRLGIRTADMIAGAMYRIGRAGIRGAGRGVRGGISGLAGAASILGAGAGGMIGQIAGIATGALLIGPSLMGLLNPTTLLIGALAGGVYAWVRFSESGQRALKKLKEFMEPLIKIGKMMVEGIKLAFEGNDLTLAGKIAIVGLKAALLTGFAQIVNGIGGIWGDALGALGTELLSGNFMKSWEVGVSLLRAGWSSFMAFMVSSFIAAGREIAKYWKETSLWIGEQIHKVDPETAVNVLEEEALDMLLLRSKRKELKRLEQKKADDGISVHEERAMADLRKQIAAGEQKFKQSEEADFAAGNRTEGDWLDRSADSVRNLQAAIGEFASLTPEQLEANINAGLDALETGKLADLRAAAAKEMEGLKKSGVVGGAAKAKSAADKATDELRALVEEARAKAAAAKKKTEEEGAGVVGAKTAGGLGGPGGGKFGAGGGEALVTFSAIEAALGSTSGGIGEKLIDKTAKVVEHVDMVAKKIDETKAIAEAAVAVMRGFTVAMTVI